MGPTIRKQIRTWTKYRKIIEEIQKSHKEDDFYLQIHKFDYVEPEDTEA